MTEEIVVAEVWVLGIANYGGAWGWGATREQALRAAVKQGGLDASKGYRIFHFGPDTEVRGVTMLGTLEWSGPGPVEVEEVEAK